MHARKTRRPLPYDVGAPPLANKMRRRARKHSHSAARARETGAPRRSSTWCRPLGRLGPHGEPS
ncbi:hypothetical protein PUN4_890027 [Paraburkholderia unamae]|nr:hypothetical protein PUN4_890027 [Paraburkholderia unamae]